MNSYISKTQVHNKSMAEVREEEAGPSGSAHDHQQEVAKIKLWVREAASRRAIDPVSFLKWAVGIGGKSKDPAAARASLRQAMKVVEDAEVYMRHQNNILKNNTHNIIYF